MLLERGQAISSPPAVGPSDACWVRLVAVVSRPRKFADGQVAHGAARFKTCGVRADPRSQWLD